MDITTNEDLYEDYESFFFPNRRRQLARRTPAVLQTDHHHPPPESIVEQMQGEEEFMPSFSASHNERRMLQAQLTSFYQEHIITDVLAPVKGGKEATVYCCQAHPSTGLDLIAAKIYRPRAFRSLRNDAVYKEGRESLDAEGKAIRDTRRHRALAKKTRYGKEVDIGSWIEHEFATMKMLYEAGADVPKPLARAGTTILMEYLGDVRLPAPALVGVTLDASAGPGSVPTPAGQCRTDAGAQPHSCRLLGL